MNDIAEDMLAAISDFRTRSNTIIDALVTEIEKYEPPNLIYHYTNDVGLRGIIESGKIWIANAFKLNDPTEVIHGFSCLMAALKLRRDSDKPEIAAFVEGFEAFVREGGIQEAAHIYVCSFSESNDDLGQWRAYGDNGCGFALAFDSKEIETAFVVNAKARKLAASTFPVNYDHGAIERIQNTLVELILPLLSLPRGKQISGEAISSYFKNLSVLLSSSGMLSSLFFKHEAYANEKEYRLQLIHQGGSHPPSVKFRTRPHGLIDYLEFDWRSVAPGALKKIVVGPAGDRDRANQFARDCLQAFGGIGVEIVPSTIPYRVA
ncbi:MAG: DUF2971 domain-containing protein [Alphaproteobacteria bacterium]